MKDKAIMNAIARRDELVARVRALTGEIQNLQQELSSVHKFIEDYRRYAGLTPEEDADLFGVHAPAIPERAGSNPRKEDLAPLIRQMILDRHKPLSRNAIFSALEGSNIHLKGRDPKMILSTMLWRMPDKFVRLQGHGYWLTELPYDPAGYIPAAAPPERKGIRRR